MPKRHVDRRKAGQHSYRHTTFREVLDLVREMATRDATIADLTRVTGTSRATLHRLLAKCKSDLRMRITCRAGIYAVRDWGVLNRRRIVPHT